MAEIYLDAQQPVTRVMMGTMHQVILEKLYGPTAACSLRIEANIVDSCWVIERERLIQDSPPISEWVEVVRIPLQPDDDLAFTEET